MARDSFMKSVVSVNSSKDSFDYDDMAGAMPSSLPEPDKLEDFIALDDLDYSLIDESELLDPEKDFPGPKGAEERDVPAQVDQGLGGLSRVTDPVKMYLREMGHVSLLSKDEEVVLAKTMEAGEREVISLVMKTGVGLETILDIGRKLLTGECRLKDIVRDADYEEGSADLVTRREQVLKGIDDIRSQSAKLANYMRRVEEEERTASGERLRHIRAYKQKYMAGIETLVKNLRLERRQFDVMVERLRVWEKDHREKSETIEKNLGLMGVESLSELEQYFRQADPPLERAVQR